MVMVRGLPSDAAAKLHDLASHEGAVLVLYLLTLKPPRAAFSEIDTEKIQYWLDRGVYPAGLVLMNSGRVEVKVLDLNLPDLPTGVEMRGLVELLLRDIAAQVWALTRPKAA